MQSPDDNAGQWNVVVRTRGEILAAAAIEPFIELGVLGVPKGFGPSEIEGWLHDLIGVARETGRADEKPRPIPALLHHGLTGLLFSHAQLWNRDGERHPASYAAVHGNGVVAFGWVGQATIEVHVGGRRVDPGEIIVRDEDGREARALELPDADPVVVRFLWEPGEGAMAVLEASWPGTTAAATLEAAPLRDTIEMPLAPHPAPDVPVVPMEGIVRDTFQAQSFLDASSDPLDLDTLETAGPSARGPSPEPAPQHDAREPVPHEGHAHAVDVPSHAQSPPASSPQSEPGAAAPAAPPAQTLATPAAGVPVAEQLAHETPAPEADAPPAAHEPVSGEARLEAPEPAIATLDDPDLQQASDEQSDEMFRTADDDEPRPSRLRRLFDRFTFWRKPKAEDAPDEAHATAQEAPMAAQATSGVPEQVPPTPEPAEVTARAVPHAGAESAHEDEAFIGMPVEGAADEEEISVQASADGIEPHAASPEETPAIPEPDAAHATAPVEPHLAPDAVSAPVAGGADMPVAGPSGPAHGPVPEPHVVEPAAATVAQMPDAPAGVMEPHPATAAAEAPSPAAAAPPQAPVRTPMRPQWPAAEELKPPAPLWRRPWAWAVLMAALFAGGWIIGHMNDERRSGAMRGVRNALRSVGLGGSHYEVMVNSRPPGAWISVNGEDLARRTPASIELEPGEHDVTLSFSDLGSATFTVRGLDGDRLALDPPLWGSIHVYSSDEEVPVAVSIDGVARGFAPLVADSLQPGAHEVRFSGPGLPSWGQTVQVRVQESQDLIARPMTSPATGVIEVRASMATETGSLDVEGAKVWLDGELAGQTPLTLELPRGPHSIRVEHMGESAPVQVIDLPGGNQRFASFTLRPGADFPVLQPIDPPAEIPLDAPTVVSMGLEGVSSTEVREMWLHVQTPDGPYRRYQMAWLKSPGGVVGVAVFPTTMFDADGRVRFYASASTQGGDEYFSEVRVASRPGAQAPPTAARRR